MVMGVYGIYLKTASIFSVKKEARSLVKSDLSIPQNTALGPLFLLEWNLIMVNEILADLTPASFFPYTRHISVSLTLQCHTSRPLQVLFLLVEIYFLLLCTWLNFSHSSGSSSSGCSLLIIQQCGYHHPQILSVTLPCLVTYYNYQKMSAIAVLFISWLYIPPRGM